MSARYGHFVESILDQLDALGGVSVRRMFGGFGLYRQGVMFALIADEQLFYKVDASTQPGYVQAESQPFTYEKQDKNGGTKAVSLSYWELPAAVLEESEMLQEWTLKACEVAMRQKLQTTKKNIQKHKAHNPKMHSKKGQI